MKENLIKKYKSKGRQINVKNIMEGPNGYIKQAADLRKEKSVNRERIRKNSRSKKER